MAWKPVGQKVRRDNLEPRMHRRRCRPRRTVVEVTAFFPRDREAVQILACKFTVSQFACNCPLDLPRWSADFHRCVSAKCNSDWYRYCYAQYLRSALAIGFLQFFLQEIRKMYHDHVSKSITENYSTIFMNIFMKDNYFSFSEVCLCDNIYKYLISKYLNK